MSIQSKLAALLAGLYFIGAAAYSVVVPVWEGPDEREHFAYVVFVAENWRLPHVVEEYGAYTALGTHGPLYYALSAALVQSLDLSDASALPLANPQGTANDLEGLGNKNGHIHTPLEAWPYRADIIRALHIARLVSAAFGALCVAATVLLAARYSLRVAVLAGLFVAALPEFLFLGALVNNDVPGAAMATVGLLLLMRYWERPGWKPALLAGAAIGLAVLTKIGGVWLLPLAAGVVLSRRRAAWRALLSEGLLVLFAFLLVCGWWLALNVVRYGDPTGLTGNMALMPGEQVDYTDPANLFGLIRFTTYTFWAVFGATTIAAPAWVYVVLTLLTLVALLGIRFSAKPDISRSRPEVGRLLLFICLGWALLILGAGVAWEMRVGSWHGRLFFPAIAAYATLAAIGIDGWRRRYWAGAVMYALPIVMLVLALLSPSLLIAPAYAPPRSVAALPAQVEPLCVVYEEDGLELLGVEADDEVRPGGVLDAVFYWRLRRPLTYDLILFTRVLDHDLIPIAGDNSYHGRGNWPTKLWEPGVIYADRVQLRVDEAASTPTLGRLVVVVHRYGDDVPASCNGNLLDPVMPLAQVRVVEPQPKPKETLLVLGETVALASVEWPDAVRRGEILQVDLLWYVRSEPGGQLTRFAHLERDGQLVAQSDEAPAGFPASAWRPGDVLPDTIRFQLPADTQPGTYTLRVGMYDSQGVRLPNEAPDDRALLGTVEVKP